MRRTPHAQGPPTMPEPKETTKVVRAGLERVCDDFSMRVAPLGFRNTKKMWWTRRRPSAIDFIHFQRSGSSYGAPRNFSESIAIHLGIRVLNDAGDFAVLNGPQNDAARTFAGRYHHRFNARSGDTHDLCLDDLVRFVEQQGEPWFQKFRSADDLLQQPDSPLGETEKQFLADALAGRTCPENETRSLKLFGIKRA